MSNYNPKTLFNYFSLFFWAISLLLTTHVFSKEGQAQIFTKIAKSGETRVNGAPFNGAFLHPIQNKHGDVAFYGTTGGNANSGIFLYSKDANEFLQIASFKDPSPRDSSKSINQILLPAYVSNKRSVLFGGFPLSSNSIDFRTVYLWKDGILRTPIALGDIIKARRLKNMTLGITDTKTVRSFLVVRIIFITMNDNDQIVYSAQVRDQESGNSVFAIFSIQNEEHRILATTEDTYPLDGALTRYAGLGRILVNNKGDITFYATAVTDNINQLVLTYSPRTKKIEPIARNLFITNDGFLVLKIEPDDFTDNGDYIIKATGENSSGAIGVRYYLIEKRKESDGYNVSLVLDSSEKIDGINITSLAETSSLSQSKRIYLLAQDENAQFYIIKWRKGKKTIFKAMNEEINVFNLANRRFGRTQSKYGTVFTCVDPDTKQTAIYVIK